MWCRGGWEAPGCGKGVVLLLLLPGGGGGTWPRGLADVSPSTGGMDRGWTVSVTVASYTEHCRGSAALGKPSLAEKVLGKDCSVLYPNGCFRLG